MSRVKGFPDGLPRSQGGYYQAASHVGRDVDPGRDDERGGGEERVEPATIDRAIRRANCI